MNLMIRTTKRDNEKPRAKERKELTQYKVKKSEVIREVLWL